MTVFTVPKFDLHVHGNKVLRLSGGVTFIHQGNTVLIINHAFKGRIVRLEGVKYPLLEDDEGIAIGLIPRLPNRVRGWLNCFY